MLIVLCGVQGPYGGSGNGVYPAAAHFFESLRVLKHKPKSVKRMQAEVVFGRYGRATRKQNDWCITLPGDILTLDDFGRLRCIPKDDPSY